MPGYSNFQVNSIPAQLSLIEIAIIVAFKDDVISAKTINKAYLNSYIKVTRVAGVHSELVQVKRTSSLL